MAFPAGLVAVAALGGLLGSKKKANFQAMPSFPAASAEEKAVSSDVAAITDYQLETQFARMTGGMKIDEFTKIQDALQAKKDFEYANESIQTKIRNKLTEKVGPGSDLLSFLGMADYKKPGLMGQTTQGDVSGYGAFNELGQAFTQSIDPSGTPDQIKSQLIDRMKQTKITGADGKQQTAYEYVNSVLGESTTVNGKSYKYSDIISPEDLAIRGYDNLVRFQTDGAKQAIAAEEPAIQKAKAAFQAANDPNYTPDFVDSVASQLKQYGPNTATSTYIQQLRNRGSNDLADALQGMVQPIVQANTARRQLPTLETYTKAADAAAPSSEGFEKFLSIYAPTVGTDSESVKRTMSDIGLYSPEKDVFYDTFQQAADDNDGAIPAKQVQGLLAAQMEMVRTGNYDEATALGKNIEANYPEFYADYFGPDGFFMDPMSPIQEMLKVNPDGTTRLTMEMPELAGEIEQALSTALRAQGDVSAGITSNLQKASGLLDRAMTELEKQGKPATQENLETWLNDRLASDDTIPKDEFDAAKLFLDDAKKYLATPTQIQQAFASLQSTGRIQNQEINDDTNWDIVQPPGIDAGRVITGQEVGAGGPMVPVYDKQGKVQTGQDGQPMMMPKMLADRYQNLQSQLALGAQTLSETLAARGALDSSVATAQMGKLINDVVGQQGRELEAEYLGMQQQAQTTNAANLLSQRQQDIAMGEANSQLMLEAQKAKVASAMDRVKAAGQTGQDQAAVLSQELGTSLDQAKLLLTGAQTATQTATGEVAAQIDYQKLMNDVAATAVDFGKANVASDAARLEAIGGVAGAAGTLAGQTAQATTTQGQNISQLANAAQSNVGQQLELESYNKSQPIQLALTNYDLMQGALGTANTFLNNQFNQRTAQYNATTNSTIQQNAIQAQQNASKNNLFGSIGGALIQGAFGGGGKGFSF